VPIVGLLDGRLRGLQAIGARPDPRCWPLAAAAATSAERGAPSATIAISLAPGLLGDPTLDARVDEVRRTAGVAAERLRIEVPERALLADRDAAGRALARLRVRGVSVHVAGVAGGWCSLSHLRTWPVDGAVVDAALVRRLGEGDRPEETLVAAIVATARSLGLTVEADGVERPDQELRLRALGCDAARGPRYADVLGLTDGPGGAAPAPRGR
jgi:EAL domain-containing protein (putative c-di-GMP-specific phosphodiesterase class I)